MAIFFLLLAVIVGVVIGDAMVANTGAGNLQLFDRSITGFTQGQLLLIAAVAGFLFTLLVFLAWGASKSRRLKRRERRTVHRDMEGRIGELERENADLRDGVDRDSRTSRLGAMAGAGETTQAQGRAAPTSPETTTRRSFFNRADR